MNDEIPLLSRLIPSLPDVREILHKVREKYNIPDVLPEHEQLAETLSQERTAEEWEAIRQEIENELRIWFQPASSDLDKTAKLFMEAMSRSDEIMSFLTSETVQVEKSVASRFIEVINKNAASGLGLLNQFFVVGSGKLLDHLITGRPITLPTEWANPVFTIKTSSGNEPFVIAIAHQFSNPDVIAENLRNKVIKTFGEKPKITNSDLELADYLNMKNTEKSIREITLLKLERDPNLIPYKKGTRKYNEAFRRLKDTTKQQLYRLQQDVNQIVGGDKK